MHIALGAVFELIDFKRISTSKDKRIEVWCRPDVGRLNRRRTRFLFKTVLHLNFCIVVKHLKTQTKSHVRKLKKFVPRLSQA